MHPPEPAVTGPAERRAEEDPVEVVDEDDARVDPPADPQRALRVAGVDARDQAASSSSSKASTQITGPKISSRAIRMAGCTPVNIVGATK